MNYINTANTVVMHCNEVFSYCTASDFTSQEQAESKCIPAPHFLIIIAVIIYLKLGDNVCKSLHTFLAINSHHSLTLDCV